MAPLEESLTHQLADGHEIPRLGLGVWQTPDGPACIDAVLWALELGYRHIDTAQLYANEASVGEALRRSGIPREQVYVTTKFHPSRKDAAVEIEGSLQRLGVDYVDLYLVHWPSGGPTWAWPAMERTHQLGHARSIGVSNFSTSDLAAVMDRATVAPVVNQIELSPFNYRRALVDEGVARGIAPEAYSPLGTGSHLDDETVNRIAHRIGRTPAQVLIRWSLQHDLIVLPKSTHRHRIEENAQVFDFELASSDMDELDRLDRTDGTNDALENPWW